MPNPIQIHAPKIVSVDPEFAQSLLDENADNRKINQTAVRQYTDAMTRGLWHFDGAPIRIATGGRLLDGQHRLLAIIASKTTQQFLIIENIDPTTQATMDTGRRRTLVDALSMRGEAQAPHLGSILAMVTKWEGGSRGTALFYGSNSDKRHQIAQMGAMLDYFEENRAEIRALIAPARRLANVLGTSTRITGLALWLFRRIDAADADDFMRKTITGEGLEAGHPILALRHALMRDEGGNTADVLYMKLSLIIKAWNLYRGGKTIQRLYFITGGSRAETFPIPQ